MHLRVIGVTFNILTNAVKINDIKCDSPFCVLTTAVLRITTAVKVPRMLFMVATALMLLHILLLFYLKNGNNTQNYNIKFTNSAWNVQGTTTMKWDHHLPCVSSVRYLISKSLECFVSTQLLYPQCYEENLILIQHRQRDKMKSSNGNNLMS